MSKHTPGPWAVDGHFVVRGDGIALCNVWASRPVSNAEAEANARLIATAPELMDALKDAVSFLDEAAAYEEDPERFRRIKAALAKAKGE